MKRELQIETSVGLATAAWDGPARPRSILLLGHGAGGGVDARDLVAVRNAAVAAGHAVALTTQPYRVAGRRAPAPAKTLDVAFTEIVAAVVGRRTAPVVVGGRSSGARVACRTSAAVGAAGVLALSFPLHPPGRPEKSRADELRSVLVPTLVVQGERDSFGSPAEVDAPPLPGRFEIHPVPGGNHGFAITKGESSALPGIASAVVAWLDRLLAAR
ncbi:MAG TPA: alpha/beta family hydrolase [Mycobacteriales bacterium]|nr:alpha/beta family hydrolase [Mycobacteriales bacterium]